jgi:hypothetical protein
MFDDPARETQLVCGLWLKRLDFRLAWSIFRATATTSGSLNSAGSSSFFV